MKIMLIFLGGLDNVLCVVTPKLLARIKSRSFLQHGQLICFQKTKRSMVQNGGTNKSDV